MHSCIQLQICTINSQIIFGELNNFDYVDPTIWAIQVLVLIKCTTKNKTTKKKENLIYSENGNGKSVINIHGNQLSVQNMSS